MPFIYWLSTPEQELELAQAELWALTGAQASGKVALSAFGCDIRRSAYVGLCGALMAEAGTLSGLCDEIARQAIAAEGFRIEVQHQAPRVTEGYPQIATQLADALMGVPDLSAPRVRFWVLCQQGQWRFARVLSSSDRGYLRQQGRPRNFSHALPARQARALVNLVAAPGDTLLDPCCGVGTCLLEAHATGIRAEGMDLSRLCAEAARENLRHFGAAARVRIGDARTIAGRWDAAVIDLPYGHTSQVAEGLYEEVLTNIAGCVERMAIVTAAGCEDLLARLGLRVLRHATVPKGDLIRHFWVLRRAQD